MTPEAEPHNTSLAIWDIPCPMVMGRSLKMKVGLLAPCALALACAANIGSAATLIGNPQNMLIGTVLKLPFGSYFLEAIVPVALGLVALWALLAWQAARALARRAHDRHAAARR